ncbi:MAG TPA: hypothetical protein VFO40_19765, partial [Chthoniobacterales bacterium]|nr:hypothetical protein [Chthoniobacterales bacterium]
MQTARNRRKHRTSEIPKTDKYKKQEIETSAAIQARADHAVGCVPHLLRAAAAQMNIVTLNIGSGGQKVLLFSNKQGRRDANLAKEPAWEAKIDTTAPDQPAGKLFVFVKVNGAPRRLELGRSSTIEERLHFVFDLMTRADTQALNELSEVDAVAHRVVHGGSKYSEAVEIDERVEKEIDRLGSLSPLHNPAQLLGVKAAKKKFGPTVPQIAIFDTAFHRSLPQEAKTYAGPFNWIEKGIIRYGFHGSSFR